MQPLWTVLNSRSFTQTSAALNNSVGFTSIILTTIIHRLRTLKIQITVQKPQTKRGTDHETCPSEVQNFCVSPIAGGAGSGVWTRGSMIVMENLSRSSTVKSATVTLYLLWIYFGENRRRLGRNQNVLMELNIVRPWTMAFSKLVVEAFLTNNLHREDALAYIK